MINLVYISGCGRSGSTILDRILGSAPETTSCNELRSIWLFGFERDNNCSCEERFSKCQFWKSVVAASGIKKTEINRGRYLQKKYDSTRYFLKLYFGLLSLHEHNEILEYSELLKRLIFAIAQVSGSDVLVDSSKTPSRPLILNYIKGVNTEVVHIIRNPAGVVYSWGKSKYNPSTGVGMKKRSLVKVVFQWNIINLFSWMLKSRFNYYLQRYEEFCSKPKSSILNMQSQLQSLREVKYQFSDTNTVWLDQIHTVSGNPDRFRVGPTNITLDEKWRHDMGLLQRAMVGFLCLIALVGFGYAR